MQNSEQPVIYYLISIKSRVASKDFAKIMKSFLLTTIQHYFLFVAVSKDKRNPKADFMDENL